MFIESPLKGLLVRIREHMENGDSFDLVPNEARILLEGIRNLTRPRGGFVADHDNCAICGKQLRSLVTRSYGGRFFCSDCGDSIVFPLVNNLVNETVRILHGDQAAQRYFSESLAPGGELRIVIGFASPSPIGDATAYASRLQRNDTERGTEPA